MKINCRQTSILLALTILIWSCQPQENESDLDVTNESLTTQNTNQNSDIEKGLSEVFSENTSYSTKSYQGLPSSRITDILTTIEEAKIAANAENLTISKIVYARGIQAYELNSSSWNAKGPLADLFPLTINDDETITVDFTKFGAHYQHLASPAWEFEDGRVIAAQATTIPGAGRFDVAWLNVDLKPNELGFKKILRIETFAGVAPFFTFLPENTRIGIGYETVYVFLS